MSALGLALTILVPLLVLAGFIWAAIHSRRRTQAFRDLASTNGWWYSKKDRSLPRELAHFAPFRKGGSPIARHILQGQHEGRRFQVFQFEYTVSSGRNRTTVHHRVARVATPIEGHDLSIEREHLGHKIMDALGGEDIDVESDAFSRMFWVRASDRRFAYDILHPRMQEMLMELPEQHWQWRGHSLLIYEDGLLAPDDVVPLLDTLDRFHTLVPRHLQQ